MSDTDTPQIYLISPPEIVLDAFADRLAAVLDAHAVACLRLALATRDEGDYARAADRLRDVAHARDVAVVVADHVGLVTRHGLDGVHLTEAARSVRKVRKTLGADAIVGAFCGASRHNGLTAAEIGADYVGFGPVGESALGSGDPAPRDLFEWWSEMIEVPVVAEGNLDAALIRDLAPVTDFFGIGDEIWRHDDPAAALGALVPSLR